MNRLIQAIENVRAKLDVLRRHSLKETPTRTIVIDPLLEALGWDIRDPDEAELEYPTIDSKSVDYALKINGKPVLLVEAKALDDTLGDVKAITQIVGYAANGGIDWCILTSGVKWKVYRSVEKCPAPDKLMFEVSLDPRDSEGLTVQQIAQAMWRFSREEMAKGTLDALGEQTFTDGKVRKALDVTMRDPPRPFLNIIKNATGDDRLNPVKIKESLARIWAKVGSGPEAPVSIVGPAKPASGPPSQGRSEAVVQDEEMRRTHGGQVTYDEDYHLAGKPQEIIELFKALDRFCHSLRPGSVERRTLKLEQFTFIRSSNHMP